MKKSRRYFLYTAMVAAGIGAATNLEKTVSIGKLTIEKIIEKKDEIAYHMGPPVVELKYSDMGENAAEKFQKIIQNPTVIDLGYESCRPCRALWPEYRKFPRKHPNVNFYKIDTLKEKKLVEILEDNKLIPQVKFVPFLLYFNNGELVETHNRFFAGDIELIESKINKIKIK